MKQKKTFQHVIAAIVVVLMLVTSSVIAQNAQKPGATKQSKDQVYEHVDVMPAFPGGLSAFGKFLNTNIKYPANDKKNNLTGRVIAQFIVERDGTISNVKAMRSPSEAMSSEAIRVLTLSPKWKPGSIKGKPVRAEFTVPINFALENS